jgi:hypothetical protein
MYQRYTFLLLYSDISQWIGCREVVPFGLLIDSTLSLCVRHTVFQKYVFFLGLTSSVYGLDVGEIVQLEVYISIDI